jgi:hypothetical protein
MKEEACPDAIHAYAACVLKKNEDEGVLLKDACASEFAAVKECFRAVRRTHRQLAQEQSTLR